jgi:hypothetical protein
VASPRGAAKYHVFGDRDDLADSGAGDTGQLAGFGLLLIGAGVAATLGGRRLGKR